MVVRGRGTSGGARIGVAARGLARGRLVGPATAPLRPTPATATTLARAGWSGSGDTRFDVRRTLRDGLAARLEHGFQRLDAVVGGLEEEVVDDGLRLLELFHERERHRAAGHRAAELRIDAVGMFARDECLGFLLKLASKYPSREERVAFGRCEVSDLLTKSGDILDSDIAQELARRGYKPCLPFDTVAIRLALRDDSIPTERDEFGSHFSPFIDDPRAYWHLGLDRHEDGRRWLTAATSGSIWHTWHPRRQIFFRM